MMFMIRARLVSYTLNRFINMLKRVALTLVLFVLIVKLASARSVWSPRTVLSDTTVYYLDGKVVSSEYFHTLDANTLTFIDVNRNAGTVRGFTKDTAPTDLRSYQSKGTKIDWSVAKTLRDVSFVVNDQVTDAQEARSIAGEQIQSVYQLPASATGPTGEVGSFGRNGVIVITTKKK